jgi:membrane-associated phospholipid phosphatase
MALSDGTSGSAGYGGQFVGIIYQSFARLLRKPQPFANAEPVQRLRRDLLVLSGVCVGAILLLMFSLDATVIALMPPRGAPGLWPVRILTEFGKDDYVLSLLALLLVVMAVIAPLWPQTSRGRLFHFGTQVQYLFFTVLVPVLCGQVLKWIAGRGRPFVGGKANAFNFEPFNGTAAYSSLPSSHAVTAFALAFAVAAVWPQLRFPIYLYAVAIALSRIVLLAHHPSDVVAGALVGLAGAMVVRYWFAARRLGFTAGESGRIVPR